MVFAAILAGGKGTRMGNQDIPKQFLKLGNKPIIVHTIEQFILNKNVDKILILCPKEWITNTIEMLKIYFQDTSKLFIIEGGETRHATILNACSYIYENYNISDNDIIITHDAVRPFLTQRMIDENIELAKEYGAVNTVIPSTDTIVESFDGESITSIPIRNYMFQGQSPQTFKIKKMKRIFDSLTDEEKSILTDACKAFIIRNEKVALVKGEVFNIKITTTFDLKLADAIINEKSN